MISKIITADISDHFPILLCHNVPMHTSKKPLVFTHRDLSAKAFQSMRNWLSNCDWEDFDDTNSVEHSLSN